MENHSQNDAKIMKSGRGPLQHHVRWKLEQRERDLHKLNT